MEIRKQDHNEIKAYLINYINTLWNKDKDFVEVYGKDYPKIQLERNLREFKFNRSTSLNISGEYDLIRRNIYVYNYKYPILTLHNLIKSPIVDSLMKTILHELIHAVFSKNLDTEQDPNKHVTGLEIYDEVHKKVINSPLVVSKCIDFMKIYTTLQKRLLLLIFKLQLQDLKILFLDL